jgi:hypothetical protein
MKQPKTLPIAEAAPLGIGFDDLLGDFKPSLNNVSGNIWEACITLPVVGTVTTQGNGWQEAKMRLWLVSRAVGILAERTRELQEPKGWTEAEWRSTLKTMRDVWSPNAELCGGASPSASASGSQSNFTKD